MTQHCTHLETIFYKSAVICRTVNIKHQTGATIIIIMVINPIKTKSMTIATKQQLSPLSFELSLYGAKIDEVSEHRQLAITIDNKLRWISHTNNVYKTVSRRIFLLSKLRYTVDINTRKLFFNAHIKPGIDYASAVSDRVAMSSKRDYIFCAEEL